MNAQLRPVEPCGDLVPDTVREQVAKFMLDKKTGNVTFNIKNGRILGLTVEEKLSV